MSSAKRIPLLLVPILVLSLALGLWFASWELHDGRFWDERFSVDNLRSLFETGDLRPENGFYQSLSYLPQAVLLGTGRLLDRVTGLEVFTIYQENGELTEGAYFLCRSVQTLYALANLVLVFFVGRRLFSREVGLVGALILAAVPWHVHASGVFKPDVLLTLTALLTLWWSFDALAGPSRKSYALAGVGVALALSTKLIGGVTAIPLVWATLVSRGDFKKRLGLLIVAGCVAVAVFLLLNPFFAMYYEFFAINVKHYEQRAEEFGGTKLSVLANVARLIVAWNVHGLVLGLVSAAAALALWITLIRGARPDGDRDRRLARGMFLSFPPLYVASYVAVTSNFKANNFLPLWPFTSLLAAWALVSCWSWAAERVRVLDRPASRAVAMLALAAILLPRPVLYVYRSLVPSTHDLAMRTLRARFVEAGEETLGSRLTVFERWQSPRPAWDNSRKPGDAWYAIDLPERLDELPAAELDRADGVVFPSRRLDEERPGVYVQRLARARPEQLRRLEPRLFKARGPALVTIAHPWRPRGAAIPLPARSLSPTEGRFELPAELESGTVFSFALQLRDEHHRMAPPRLELGGRELAVVQSGWDRPTRFFTSERLRLEDGPRGVRCTPVDGELRELQVSLQRWSAP